VKARLRQSEEELRVITDSIRQFIVVLARDGTTLYANKLALENVGFTVLDLTNENLLTGAGLPRQAEAPGELGWNQVWRKSAHPDDLNRIQAERRKGLLQEAPFELEGRLLLKNGQYRWQLFRYNPLKDEYGQIIRWYVTATDIDDRKGEDNVRLEERTRIAQELRDTLLQAVQAALMHLAATLFGMNEDSRVKKRLEQIVELMSQGIEEGRNAIQGLRSSRGSENLIVALSAIRHELQISPDIDFRAMVTGRQIQFPTQTRNEIYRIGREALPLSDGFLLLSPEGIETAFAQDLTKEEKSLLVAVQPQTSASIFGAKPTAAAWRSKPSWYIVATNDNMIAPEQEKSMAKQISAATTVLPSSHVAMLSHPKEVAKVIEDASAGKK
jgi:signal transduction histidine kinase